MPGIPTQRFLNRVLSSTEKAAFSSMDAYGHLSTSRYVEMFVDHRMTAAEQKSGLDTNALLRDMRLGLVFRELRSTFLAPVMLGDELEIASWADSLGESGFTLKGVM